MQSWERTTKLQVSQPLLKSVTFKKTRGARGRINHGWKYMVSLKKKISIDFLIALLIATIKLAIWESFQLGIT